MCVVMIYILEFRTKTITRQHIAINGDCIEVVNVYKYSGTVIDVKHVMGFVALRPFTVFQGVTTIVFYG